MLFCAEPLEGAPAHGKPTDACHRVMSNCNVYGECIKRRDWCLLRGRKPTWLQQRFPGGWPLEARPAYLAGRSEGNPTHVACLHVLPLLRWMTAANISLGQVPARSPARPLRLRVRHVQCFAK